MPRPHASFVFAVLGFAMTSCKPAPAASTASATPTAASVSSQSQRPAGCPACQCECNCGEASTELRDRQFSLGRKIAHRDPSCMEDLARIRELDPKMDRYNEYSRGMCEMIAGKCKAGKARMTRYLQEQSALPIKQARRSVEQMGSMYCTGPLGPREEVLRSMMALQSSGVSKELSSQECSHHFEVVMKLEPRVKPRDDEDHDIKSLRNNLLVVGPQCFARLGECKKSFSSFRRVVGRLEKSDHYFYGVGSWKKMGKAQQQDVLRANFQAINKKCEGRI